MIRALFLYMLVSNLEQRSGGAPTLATWKPLNGDSNDSRKAFTPELTLRQPR